MNQSGETPVPNSASSGFCHLHVHSDFSALDGACKVTDLVRRAAELKMPAVALTDHGVLSGSIQFYQAAKKAGVKPILGLEAYVVEDRLRKDFAQEQRWHLTLLAENAVGYRNLLRLGSRAFLEGYYFKPRVDYELLREHAEGIICLSGCPTGRLSKAVEHTRADEARKELVRLQEIFGEGNVFLEVQQTAIEELEHVAGGIIALARETGVPAVATNDVHYLEARDAEAHDVLLCIQTGSRISDHKRMRFSSQEFYFKTEEEMREAFRDYPEAVTNTLLVAERCDVELKLGEILLPSYPVPEGHTEATYLRELCEEGLRRRYGDEVGPEQRERLESELCTIEEMGFPRLLPDRLGFRNYAKTSGIPVGPGRGSRGGLPGQLSAGHHRSRPAQIQSAFRALPQPGADQHARYRHRLLVDGRDRSSSTWRTNTGGTGWRRSPRSAPSRRARPSATRPG